MTDQSRCPSALRDVASRLDLPAGPDNRIATWADVKEVVGLLRGIPRDLRRIAQLTFTGQTEQVVFALGGANHAARSLERHLRDLDRELSQLTLRESQHPSPATLQLTSKAGEDVRNAFSKTHTDNAESLHLTHEVTEAVAIITERIQSAVKSDELNSQLPRTPYAADSGTLFVRESLIFAVQSATEASQLFAEAATAFTPTAERTVKPSFGPTL